MTASAKKLSGKDLIATAFSQRDRRKLWIPDGLADQSDANILSWVHRSGHVGYAVYKNSGIVLSRTNMTSPNKVCMCDWCLSVYHSTRMASFSYRKDQTSTVSFYLCSELDCVKRMQSPETNDVHNMRETLSKEERLQRYQDRVGEFWREHVFAQSS